jgi:multidrug efflux pump subunit AcrA (membrane-fusion protein)
MSAKPRTPAAFGLRLRLVLMRMNPVAAGAWLLLFVLAGALAWVAVARTQLEREREAFQARAVQQAAQAAAAARAQDAATAAQAEAQAAQAAQAAPERDNLAAFYGTLGERRYAERQVRTLFALAEKSGLTLRQGEYKSALDRNGRVATYQVNLPVKGSYAAIWQFAMAALRAIPFAALDDISFRREAIGDTAVEARLRLTLYLRDGAAPAAAQAGAAP